ncbi:MAG: fluoride efflux transporter CrcB [Bacteroidota bacterium]
MYKIFFLVGSGGFLGSVSRYYSHQIISRYFPAIFPFGTLGVNLVGCFLIGIIYGLAEKGTSISPDMRIFLTAGFCGGFTTFSAFSLDSLKLINSGDWIYFTLYITASVVIGILATFGGAYVSKLF